MTLLLSQAQPGLGWHFFFGIIFWRSLETRLNSVAKLTEFMSNLCPFLACVTFFATGSFHWGIPETAASRKHDLKFFKQKSLGNLLLKLWWFAFIIWQSSISNAVIGFHGLTFQSQAWVVTFAVLHPFLGLHRSQLNSISFCWKPTNRLTLKFLLFPTAWIGRLNLSFAVYVKVYVADS